MSTTTTSASCFSAIPRATVAPTFPAPPTTVTFRFITRSSRRARTKATTKTRKHRRVFVAASVLVLLHMTDNGVPELRRLQLRRAVHETREVVGHPPGGNRAVHALHDPIGGLVPAQVPQHHLAGQNHRAGVHFVLIGVLRRRPVRR